MVHTNAILTGCKPSTPDADVVRVSPHPEETALTGYTPNTGGLASFLALSGSWCVCNRTFWHYEEAANMVCGVSKIHSRIIVGRASINIETMRQLQNYYERNKETPLF